MAVSYKSTGDQPDFTLQCVEVTDLENVGLNDLTGAASSIYSIDIDNIDGGSPTIIYFKLYDDKSPTYGTTDPNVMIRVSANVRQVWTIAQGLSTANGVSLMASKADGPDAAAAPDTAVDIDLVMT